MTLKRPEIFSINSSGRWTNSVSTPLSRMRTASVLSHGSIWMSLAPAEMASSRRKLPNPFRIIGFARREKSDAAWREELKEALQKYSRTKKVDSAQWQAFSANVLYCQGDFSDVKAYAKLAGQVASFGHEGLRRNLLH